MSSIFETLNAVDVSAKIEKKNGLSYLSWAWAWGEVKKVVPDASYTIYERETEHGPVNYFTDGKTCWVKTGVTLNGLEHIEELPVMDFKNRSVPLEAVTSMDVNKAIQRSLTKACARHGLGLYVYQGEDLPEEAMSPKEAREAATVAAQEVGKQKLAAMDAQMEQAKAAKPVKAKKAGKYPELRRLMDADGITELGLQQYLVSKGKIAEGTKIDDYPADCVTKFLIPKWGAIADKIRNDPEYTPF